jgi:hypothetical protein
MALVSLLSRLDKIVAASASDHPGKVDENGMDRRSWFSMPEQRFSLAQES